jgi:hypothetical protein
MPPLAKLEAELRPIARDRIATGQLPRETPARLWAGRGTGQLCALCDKPIQRNEVEYDVERHIDEGVQMFPFHVDCESVWQLECARGDFLVKRP